MLDRSNLFEIEAGLADILHFGNGYGCGLYDTSGRKYKVNGESVNSLNSVYIFGGYNVQYDSKGKLEYIGRARVQYDNNKISYIGSFPVEYDDKNPKHLNQIGPFEVIYSADSDQIASVGGETIAYDSGSIYNCGSYPRADNATPNRELELSRERQRQDERNRKQFVQRWQEQKKLEESAEKKFSKRSKNEINIRLERVYSSLKTICFNDNFWLEKTRRGSLPDGVAQMREAFDRKYWRASTSSDNYRSVLECCSGIGADKYSEDFLLLHSLFRGRDKLTNSLYGVLSKLFLRSLTPASRQRTLESLTITENFLRTYYQEALSASCRLNPDQSSSQGN